MRPRAAEVEHAGVRVSYPPALHGADTERDAPPYLSASLHGTDTERDGHQRPRTAAVEDAGVRVLHAYPPALQDADTERDAAILALVRVLRAMVSFLSEPQAEGVRPTRTD